MSACLEASARPTIDPWFLTPVLIATNGTGTVTRKPIKIESNRQIILKKPFCFESSFIFTTRCPFFKKPTSVITFHLRVLSEMVYYNLIQCKTLLFDFSNSLSDSRKVPPLFCYHSCSNQSGRLANCTSLS